MDMLICNFNASFHSLFVERKQVKGKVGFSSDVKGPSEDDVGEESHEGEQEDEFEKVTIYLCTKEYI